MLMRKNKERSAAEEQFRQEVRKGLETLSDQTLASQEQLRKLSEGAAAEQESLSSVQKEIGHIRGDLSRQNMALEDCLETLSTFAEERENIRKQKRTMEQEREKLLQLISFYQQQLWNIKVFAARRDPAWQEQFSLLEKAAREKMLSCRMVPVGEEGESIDYELHEVLKTVETKDKNSDRKVAAVYRPGLLYQGNVVQKAQVAVYQISAEAEEEA